MSVDPRLLADPSRWTVHVLPLPKRQRTANSLGFCGGEAVGESYGSGYRGTPVRWTSAGPEVLTFDGQKRVGVRRSHDREIAGFWQKSDGAHGGAIGWKLADGGVLLAQDLHDKQRFEWTMALGAGGGAFCGYGLPKSQKGVKGAELALYWDGSGSVVAFPVPESDNFMEREARAIGTDGTWAVGVIGRAGGQQAALWKVGEAGFTLLGDRKSLSEAYGVRDGEQVGVRWIGRGARAALWRGSANSFIDLTPANYQSACAQDCAGGLQAGFVTRKDVTRNGSASMAVRAALWAGSAASHLDLHAFVPAPWNASAALAIEIYKDRILVAGNLTQYTVMDELTSRECHSQAGQCGAIWEGKLG